MKDIILNQFKKVKKAVLPENYEDLLEIEIKKSTAISSEDIRIGKYYLVKFEDYIVKPFDGFTLHANWNNNIPPKDIYMNCEILDIMGKMVKLHGSGMTADNKDTGNIWTGWVPKKSMQILKEL